MVETGRRIAAVREAAGLKNSDLADAADIKPRTFDGKMSDPPRGSSFSSDELRAIAKRAEAPLGFLLHGWSVERWGDDADGLLTERVEELEQELADTRTRLDALEVEAEVADVERDEEPEQGGPGTDEADDPPAQTGSE